MSNAIPIIHAERQGESLWYDGGLLTFKLTGKQTGGALLLLEVLMPKGKTTPLHVHDEIETFYVLDGQVLVHSEGGHRVVDSGTVVSIPAGVPHAFLVTSPTVRMLAMLTPAGSTMEAFFRDLGEPAKDLTLAPTAPADMKRMFAAAQRAGLKVLGPPPFEEQVTAESIKEHAGGRQG